jgi:peptide/nickel transport system substrate-binding protein
MGRRFTAVWILLLFLATACSRPTEAPRPTDQPPITVPASQRQVPSAEAGEVPVAGGTLSLECAPLDHLLPFTIGGGIERVVYEALAEHDPSLQIRPALARAWHVEGDSTFLFALREGVRWHDGHPFTARDVVFTLQSRLHPEYPTPVAGRALAEIRGAGTLYETYRSVDERVRRGDLQPSAAASLKVEAWEEFRKAGAVAAIDTLTVRVELERPYAPFLSNLTWHYILPEHLFREYPGRAMLTAPAARQPVGTGPYRLVTRVAGSHYVLERNPDWHGMGRGLAPHIDFILCTYASQSSPSLVKVERGEYDLGYIPPEHVAHFARVPHIRLLTFPVLSYQYMGYNLKGPLFADVRVRRALTHAIDRQAIVDQVYFGQGMVIHSHGIPARWDYEPNVAVHAYSPARAEQLLDEAGWTRGAGGLRAKDGRQFTFTLTYPTGNKARESSAEMIRQFLEQVGIRVTPEAIPFPALMDRLAQDAVDAVLLGWFIAEDPDTAYGIWHSSADHARQLGYGSEALDRLLEQGRTTFDQAARRQVYAQLQRVLAEEQPYTWLLAMTATAAVGPRLRGIGEALSPVVGPHHNFYEWWLAR